MRRASAEQREWLREVRQSLEDWIEARPRAKKIIAGWEQQRANPDVLYYLLYGYSITSQATALMYLFRRLRPHVKKAANQFDSAYDELNRAIQTPGMPEFLRSKVIEAFCDPIQGLRKRLLFVLPAERFPRRRPHDRYTTMFMRDVSQYLEHVTGRPHWREISELVNELEPGKNMTPGKARIRVFQHQERDSHTVRMTLREARKFWETSGRRKVVK